MHPKVSVITVCYNAEEFIENAINCVLDHMYNSIEYIIIDGNSTDNTVSIINKYKDSIKYFLSEPDNGIYDAMNKGINAASGNILYFLDSDDLFHDKYDVENVVKTFNGNQDLEIVYGPIIIENPYTNTLFLKTHENVTKSFFIENVICQQAIYFKVDVFNRIGLFDKKYKIVGDYEFELRAFYKYNIKRKYVPQVIAIYRDGGISVSKEYSELHKEEYWDAFFRYLVSFSYTNISIFIKR